MTLTLENQTDPRHFRRVLGNYPTGVCVITALDPELGPIGMTVGSFTSVSLDPALVAFLPIRESGTYQRIRSIGKFCVNVLASDQDELCRLFARRGNDKFAGSPWHPAPSGAPVLDGTIAWIDCELAAVHEAGDHDIVIGAVTGLDVAENPLPPLLFFQGGYGRFSTLSLLAGSDDGLSAQLQLANRARPYIASLAEKYDVDCHASAVVDDDLVQLAYAGGGGTDTGLSKVGLRLPFVPPMGSLFVAWAGGGAVDAWLAKSGKGDDAVFRARFDEHLALIRRQGWIAAPDDDRLYAMESVVEQLATSGVLPARQRQLQNLLQEVAEDYAADVDPATDRAHSISAPVFDRNRDVVLTLTLYERLRRTGAPRAEYQAALLDAAAQVTRDIGGSSPA
ncbi:flavin reductase [Arthrobacter sp. I2-34]|uniref:Flavin reductase n=1 Tax=Arthrobacter hankyongi TaxID=2904801 RepID=A0ABS9L8H6_9MICC|nr:flavin reductase [Arthrobacter hankyongi]MCG2622980.1 flavin reductase [Arthrobacter hankyongi]